MKRSIRPSDDIFREPISPEEVDRHNFNYETYWRLHHALLEAELSMQDFANLLCLDMNTVQSWLNGHGLSIPLVDFLVEAIHMSYPTQSPRSSSKASTGYCVRHQEHFAETDNDFGSASKSSSLPLSLAA